MGNCNLEPLTQKIEYYKGKKAVFILALADLDFFANISEKIGNTQAAAAIDNIVLFFQSFCNEQDAQIEFFRIDDDEFALLFVQTDLTQAKDSLEKFKKRFRRQKFIGGETVYAGVPITFSIGLAELTDSTETATGLKMAEIALAMAKKRGRSRVEIAPAQEPRILTDRNAAVSTYAGAGLCGCCEDNEPVHTARISQPYGICMERDGSLLLADRGNHRILRIRNGFVRVVAGRGVSGFDADNLPATRSRLCKPSGVAVTPLGALVIADTGNNRIRAVDESGVLRTIAGGAKPGYAGDGGPASESLLSRPGGVAVDGQGNIFTNDYGNNVIRRISCDGKIETVVGSGEFGFCRDGTEPRRAALNKPYGLAVSSDGTRIYIADYGSNRVLLADLGKNRMETVCGSGEYGYSGDGGAGAAAALNGPYWITNVRDRALIIVDAGNHCIREHDLRTGIVRTVAGDGHCGYIDSPRDPRRARFNIPAGSAADREEHVLYVADYANNAVRKVRMGQ